MRTQKVLKETESLIQAVGRQFGQPFVQSDSLICITACAIKPLSQNSALVRSPLLSIEYAIEYSCGPRRRYGEKQLRELGRTANLHARVISGSVDENRTPTRESVDFVTKLAPDMTSVEEVAKS